MIDGMGIVSHECYVVKPYLFEQMTGKLDV